MDGLCLANDQPNGWIDQDGSIPKPAWYVIHARSQCEAKVESALQRQGLEIFLPRITVRSRRKDRRLFLQVPLFSSYLFVRTALEPWTSYEIIKLPWVVRLVGVNGCPGKVPQEQVDSIKAIVASERPYAPWPYLRQGRQVRIMEGPLAGTVGTILRRRENKQRLVVAVELFQRSVAVELEDEAVEPWF